LAVIVVPSSGSSAMSMRGLARRRADLLADIEHRGLVTLAFADHHRAIHVKFVEGRAHGLYSSSIGCLFVAAADQARGTDRRSFGDTHHFEHEDTVQNLGCCGVSADRAAGRAAGEVVTMSPSAGGLRRQLRRP
jgi:hypothetical protein